VIPADRVILEEAEERHWRWTHALLAVIVLGLTAMWIYALFFASQANRNRIADHAWAQRNEQICVRYRNAILALPQAHEAKNPSDRAVVLDQANVIVDAMVAELKTNAATGSDRELTYVRFWLDDYSAFAQNRHDYADQLRTGQDARFAVKLVNGEPVNNRIDAFALANVMPSCKDPGDV
jgi:hypothetical protein